MFLDQGPLTDFFQPISIFISRWFAYSFMKISSVTFLSVLRRNWSSCTDEAHEIWLKAPQHQRCGLLVFFLSHLILNCCRLNMLALCVWGQTWDLIRQNVIYSRDMCVSMCVCECVRERTWNKGEMRSTLLTLPPSLSGSFPSPLCTSPRPLTTSPSLPQWTN